jgi:hypothetical protein
MLVLVGITLVLLKYVLLLLGVLLVVMTAVVVLVVGGFGFVQEFIKVSPKL